MFNLTTVELCNITNEMGGLDLNPEVISTMLTIFAKYEDLSKITTKDFCEEVFIKMAAVAKSALIVETGCADDSVEMVAFNTEVMMDHENVINEMVKGFKEESYFAKYDGEIGAAAVGSAVENYESIAKYFNCTDDEIIVEVDGYIITVSRNGIKVINQ